MRLTAPDWATARRVAYQAGAEARSGPVETSLDVADGATLADPLVTLTDLPSFPTSSVDGFAVRGEGPWRIVGQVLAGGVPEPLQPGTAVEIATGAMVPDGIDQLIRVEHSTRPGPGYVTGEPRPHRDWREAGEEAAKGEELLPAGTPVTPGVVGLAASCGYDTLLVHPRPTSAVLVFGDELATGGPPGDGRVRDSLGPSMPAWLRRLGSAPVAGLSPLGPVQDTLAAHVGAIRDALDRADIVCTTGGTMHGPVDHLHPALGSLSAEYVVNTVRVRPGFPMLLARLSPGIPAAPGGASQHPGDAAVPEAAPTKWIAGLPGNPQSAVVALLSLVEPLIAGLTGRRPPATEPVTLGTAIQGRGEDTHLALVRVEHGTATPLRHHGSAMLRGVAQAYGFAVIPPGGLEAGTVAELVPLPLLAGDRP